ncbi:hypothetical protein [Helicobacter sp. MIT 14-3879]|uniref:hypothetical protein n=1 Tax=Helicobacter sp. MIT 14-3879 TaxID=2040649 RepID=UPI000E1E3400|nr:hypothetical protein [Helicobacter sp. MIT 14-3879]RDU63121.1 hypothetical protein CQA44_05620 [Helicobacter sp. MIT 14-3879]
MKILIILIVSIIIGSFLYFTLKDRVDRKRYIILGILFVILIFIIVIYTHISDKQNQKYTNIIAEFNRGEDILCSGITLNNKNFTFTNGTLSFTGKKGTKFYNQIISIDECE